MKIFAPKELNDLEHRIALTPVNAMRIVSLGVVVEVETGLGAGIHFANSTYEEAGAQIVTHRQYALESADIILQCHFAG